MLSDYLDKWVGNLPDSATRLFHGRGHCYDGFEFINIDWFEPVVWVVIYGESEQDVDAIVNALVHFAEKKSRVTCVALQQRLPHGQSNQRVIYGVIPEEPKAHENGLDYYLQLSTSQNIGFFMDAKPAREWVSSEASGKRILNLFAYTCSFSVAACHAGAAKVVNIDMSKAAISTGQRNHALNDIGRQQAVFLPHDIFRSTRKLEKLGPYDLVIFDPPSRQKGSFEAKKDYARLLAKLAPMLSPKASILACLNAPNLPENFIIDAFSQSLPDFKFEKRLEQREDFPEKDIQRCLKMMVFTQ